MKYTKLYRLINLNSLVLLLLVIIAVGSSYQSFRYNGGEFTDEWWSGWWQNFSTEMFGAIATFILFELLVGSWRQRHDTRQRTKENETQRKRQQEQFVARFRYARSFEERQQVLAEMNGLGLLVGASFYADDMAGVELFDADFSKAELPDVNFVDARLWGGNFSDANLRIANLQNAILMGVNLERADLWGVKLHGATLVGAKLAHSNLERAEFDEHTVLPDATSKPNSRGWTEKSFWTPATDLRRYTDPSHPNFWQPDWIQKPRVKKKV